tara:strand:+ start:246 stop:575 length:330 start_codon:yes stop_codon:yes gene_type:complete
MTTYYAWRTNKGEKNQKKHKGKKKHKEEDNHLNWYYCADEGMETELVLAYAIYEVKYGNNISLVFPDKYIQTKTGSGKSCSGKVSKWVKKALEGEYKNDGTFMLYLNNK